MNEMCAAAAAAAQSDSTLTTRETASSSALTTPGVDTASTSANALAQGSGLERRSNHGRAAGHLVRRLRTNDGADVDPARDDPPSRAGR
jgi:hypothetical protein